MCNYDLTDSTEMCQVMWLLNKDSCGFKSGLGIVFTFFLFYHILHEKLCWQYLHYLKTLKFLLHKETVGEFWIESASFAFNTVFDREYYKKWEKHRKKDNTQVGIWTHNKDIPYLKVTWQLNNIWVESVKSELHMPPPIITYKCEKI